MKIIEELESRHHGRAHSNLSVPLETESEWIVSGSLTL